MLASMNPPLKPGTGSEAQQRATQPPSRGLGGEEAQKAALQQVSPQYQAAIATTIAKASATDQQAQQRTAERAMAVAATVKTTPTAPRTTVAKIAQAIVKGGEEAEKAKAPLVDLTGPAAKAQATKNEPATHQVDLQIALAKATSIQQQNLIKQASTDYASSFNLYQKTQNDLKTFIDASVTVIANPNNYNWTKYDGGYQGYLNNVAQAKVALATNDAAWNKYFGDYQNFIKSGESNITKINDYVSKLKDQASVITAYSKTPEWVQHPSTKWTLEYFQDGKKLTRTFDSQYDAQQFANKVASEVPQVAAMLSMVKQGLATQTDKGYVLTKPPSVMTDAEIALAQNAGFSVTSLGTSPSWNLWQWSQSMPKGSFGRAEGEYYSAMLGSFQDNVVGIYKAAGSLIGGAVHPGTPSRGDVFAWKEVTPDTVKFLKSDLTPAQQVYLYAGGSGAAFLGSYVAMLPIGVVTSGVFQAAKEIVSAAGGPSKIGYLLGMTKGEIAGVSEVAQDIASHPKLLQAMMWGPVAGYEAADIYANYKAGVPITDVLGQEALRVGSILGGYTGLTQGMKLPTKIQQLVDTYGKKYIPLNSITDPEDVRNGLLSYESRNYWDRINEFNEGTTNYAAEDHLGKLPEGMGRIWHGTPKIWEVELGEETTIPEPTVIHPDKLGGLYLADGLSPLRVSGETVDEVAAKLGLPGIRGAPQAIAVDAYIGVIPDSVAGGSPSEIRAWFQEQVGKGTAYLPPESMMTAEREANIPVGSKLLNMGDDWYTNGFGNRILISKYMLVTDDVVAKVEQAGLGDRLVDATSINYADPSSAYGKSVYLSFGVPPASVGYTGLTSLTPSQVSYIANKYGISDSDVRQITDSTSSSFKLISSPLSLTSTSSTTKPTAKFSSVPEASSVIASDSTASASYAPKPGATIKPASSTPEPSEPEPTTPKPQPPPSPTPFVPKPKPSEATSKLQKQLVTTYRVDLGYKRGRDDLWSGKANDYKDAMNKALRERVRKDIPTEAVLRILRWRVEE
jgi:hypothetical protein